MLETDISTEKESIKETQKKQKLCVCKEKIDEVEFWSTDPRFLKYNRWKTSEPPESLTRKSNKLKIAKSLNDLHYQTTKIEEIKTTSCRLLQQQQQMCLVLENSLKQQPITTISSPKQQITTVTISDELPYSHLENLVPKKQQILPIANEQQQNIETVILTQKSSEPNPFLKPYENIINPVIKPERCFTKRLFKKVFF